MSEIRQTSYAKAPQDHKEKEGTPFRMSTSGGTIEATKVSELEFGVLLELMEAPTEAAGLPILVRNGLDEENRAKLLKLRTAEAMEFLQEWQAEGTPSLPEA